MVFKKESDPKKMKKFLTLGGKSQSGIATLVKDRSGLGCSRGNCILFILEDDLLSRYGLENVDGWDFLKKTFFLSGL